MPSRFDDLKQLEKMLADELITREEFSKLKDELFLEAPESAEPVEDLDFPEPSSDPAKSSDSNGSEQTRSAPTLYKVAFALGIASVFLGGFFGLLAWATVGISVWALYSLKDLDRRWMAWTGLALGIVFSFSNAYLNGHLDSLFEQTGALAPTETASVESTSANSGLPLPEFEQAWNNAIRYVESTWCEQPQSCRSMPSLYGLTSSEQVESGESTVVFWSEELLSPFVLRGQSEGDAVVFVSATSMGGSDRVIRDRVIRTEAAALINLLCLAVYGYDDTVALDARILHVRCEALLNKVLERAAERAGEAFIVEVVPHTNVRWEFGTDWNDAFYLEAYDINLPTD